MNRTGLFIALTIAAVVGIVFGVFPELDLKLAALFYDPQSRHFIAYAYPWSGAARTAAVWAVGAIVVAALAAVVVKLVMPRRRMLISGRAVVFLLGTMALAPGLLVNGILKEQWGRARPIEVREFGGPGQFTAWWDTRGPCTGNCSFVSGDVSGAYWTLAPAALAPPTWRPAAYAAALAYGTAVGIGRMAFGAHFFTDVVFAGLISFLTIWLVYALIWRWPRTRFKDDAIERPLQRAGLTIRGVLSKVLGRRA